MKPENENSKERYLKLLSEEWSEETVERVRQGWTLISGDETGNLVVAPEGSTEPAIKKTEFYLRD